MTDEEYAQAILPHLANLARDRSTIPYGKIAERIGKHHRRISYALGYIRDQWCRPENLPWINILVVNAKTRRPGEGVTPTGVLQPTTPEFLTWWEKELDRVFDYREWDRFVLLHAPESLKPKIIRRATLGHRIE